MSTAVFARRVYDYLVAHPERHNQGGFGHKNSCGTTMCIAGTAAWLDPGIPVYGWFDDYNKGLVMLDKNCFSATSGDSVSPTDKIVARAGELLGLTPVEANQLFYTFHNQVALDVLRGHVEALEAAERVAVVEDRELVSV